MLVSVRLRPPAQGCSWPRRRYDGLVILVECAERGAIGADASADHDQSVPCLNSGVATRGKDRPAAGPINPRHKESARAAALELCTLLEVQTLTFGIAWMSDASCLEESL